MKLVSLLSSIGIAITGILAIGAISPAQAIGTLLTSELGYTGLGLDLSAYATGDNNYTNGPSPIPGGITFTSTVPFGSTLGQNSVEAASYDLGSNGTINRSPVFAGLDSSTGELVFSFDTPVQQFGAFLNYAPGSGIDPTISTYNSAGNFLTAFNLRTDGGAISTPGGTNQFLFRGIIEESAIISSFRLGGSFMVASGSANGQLPTSVPEPFTVVGTIIGGTAALRMRKKLKVK